MNRVLTLDEVLVLPEGTRVWVEITQRKQAEWVAYAKENGIDDPTDKPDGVFEKSGLWLENDPGHWPLDRPDQLHEMRVWSLQQPPTPEELAANPWPEEEA